MTSKYVQPGNVIDYTPGSAVANGKMIIIGVRAAIALADIAANATGQIAVTGVFSYAKKTTDVIAQGAAVYYDAANDYLTTTSSGNTLAGFAVAAAGNGVTAINLKLNA